MRYPGNLKKNGKIGFLAPSFGCATQPYKAAFQNALEQFHSMGYETVLGPNCFKADGVGISNTPEKCAEEILSMFSSEADVLISCGGGELMCEVLSYLDFEKLSAVEPKWFMGYSDNTNLTYLLATMCDMASVYGPCAAAFGMEPWHQSLYDSLGVLTGEVQSVSGYGMWEEVSKKDEEHPLVPYHLTRTLEIKTFPETTELLSFSGRLLGGCMDCLVTLLGTKFDHTKEFIEKYKGDGIIWFLEACELNVFSIRRAMWQMEEAGWFRYVKGFLIGRPDNGSPLMNLDVYQAVLEVAGRKKVPVIMDLDIGHRPPMMPLVVGSLAEVCVHGNTIKISMKKEK